MLKWIRQKFCKHDYHLISVHKDDTDPTLGYKIEDIYTVYCPKCKKEVEYTELEYDKLKEKQKIDEAYKNARQINKNK